MVAVSVHAIWLGVRDVLWSDGIVGGTVALALVAVGAALAADGLARRRSRHLH